MKTIRFVFEGSVVNGQRIFASGNQGQRKHFCPNCQKKSLVKYVDVQSRDYLPNPYGKCDHASSCGYFVHPYKTDILQDLAKQKPQNQSKSANNPVLVDNIIPHAILGKLISNRNSSTFLQNLQSIIPDQVCPNEVIKVAEMYLLGAIASGAYAGATAFPFIDKNGLIRAIQVKKFNNQNHTTDTNFIHSILKQYNNKNGLPNPPWLVDYLNCGRRISCLYGEHSLKSFPNNPVCLVEAPKSAFVATLYFGIPQKPSDCLWLAVYNLTSLTYEKCQALEGRYVTLFPDLSPNGHAFELWKNKAAEFNNNIPNSFFEVSDWLERMATEEQRAAKEDLADFLLRLDWRNFRQNGKENNNNQKL